MSIRLSNGRLQVVSCESVDFNAIYFHSEAKTPEGEDGYLVWHAAGPTRTFSGSDVLQYGVTPEGFASDFGPENLEVEGQWVGITLEHQVDGEILSSVYGSFDGDKIKTQKWLSANDGGYSETACP